MCSDKQQFDFKNKTCFFVLFFCLYLIERNLLKWLCLSTSFSQQCWCKSVFVWIIFHAGSSWFSTHWFEIPEVCLQICCSSRCALSLRDSMQNLIMNQQLSSEEHHENIPVILVLASAPPGFTLKRVVCIWQNLMQLASCQDVCLLVLFMKGSITGTVAYAQELVEQTYNHGNDSSNHASRWGELLHISRNSEFLSHNYVYFAQFAQIFFVTIRVCCNSVFFCSSEFVAI